MEMKNKLSGEITKDEYKADTNRKKWYEAWHSYTIAQFNRFLLDPSEIYERRFLRGIEKLRRYDSEFAESLLIPYKLLQKRRNRLLLVIFISMMFPQFTTFLTPLRRVQYGY